MSRIQPYPLKSPFPRIFHHNQLPYDVIKLADFSDTSEGVEDLYTLIKNENFLTVLISYHNPKTLEYYCDQYDFPIKTLSWFPWALEEFRKPPSEGGLHAGAMITKDFNVDGEMLCIQSTTSGYAIINRSRNRQNTTPDYNPARISLSWEFLYKLGFLDLWKSLGDKYERGEI